MSDDRSIPRQLSAHVESARARGRRLSALAGDGPVTWQDVEWLREEGGDVRPFDEFDPFTHLDDEVDELTECDARSAAWELLVSWPLEHVQWGRRTGGEWEFSHSVVVVCTGGPHVELNTRDGAWHGYWASEHVRLPDDADLCQFFDELVR